MLMPKRTYMPIQDTPFAVKMKVLNAKQAQKNHSQSLDRLAERGGLSAAETLALVKEDSFEPYLGISEEDALRHIMRVT